MMNTSSTLMTAMLRGAYSAVVAGLIAGLTAYQTTDNMNAGVITGLLAGLGVLAARGGLEGLYDSHRDATNDQSPSDVGFGKLPPRA